MATTQYIISTSWQQFTDGTTQEARLSPLSGTVLFSDSDDTPGADNWDFLDTSMTFTPPLKIWLRASAGYAKVAVTTWSAE